ncbi:SDR family NAD(P)-dependent oxidoreductase [Ferrimonas gelatinilytica]|uniref:SDR family NAD(P)-dependent oxidoreductase n=1 Tax=Ferrimonas gelatinilytica TaxID=1255257 RepID=A0ABP9S2P3_9GAMM
MATVLITGASSGIGRQLARDYAADGWDVLACGRDPERLEAVASDKIQPLSFDVMDVEGARRALTECPRPDMVILNAGTCEYLDVENWDGEAFDSVVATNLIGISHCLGPLLPRLQSGSTLALVDSLARLLPFTRAEAYGASKAAVHYLTQTLAVDLEPRGVRVVAISPGFVETPLTDRNTFDMPTLMPVEEASERIRQGLASRRRFIAFPRRLHWTLTLLSWLPKGLKIRICQWMKRP